MLIQGLTQKQINQFKRRANRKNDRDDSFKYTFSLRENIPNEYILFSDYTKHFNIDYMEESKRKLLRFMAIKEHNKLNIPIYKTAILYLDEKTNEFYHRLYVMYNPTVLETIRYRNFKRRSINDIHNQA